MKNLVHTTIEREAMREAIARSGYSMEQRVLPILENAEYYVDPNPVYPDPNTGKPREYDFSSIAAFKTFKEELDYLFVQLEGECVNNVQPVVFFVRDPTIEFLFAEDIKCSGIPLHFPYKKNPEDEMSLIDFFELERFHHYCKGVYSTQYCTFVQKSGKNKEWMACHPDELHSAFASLISATSHAVSRHYRNWSPPEETKSEPMNLTFFYPVMIFSGDLYACSQKSGKLHFSKCDHIQFRKPVPYVEHDETYQIDVIRESYLPSFLEIVGREHQTLVRKIRSKKREVRAAVASIVRKAKALKKEDTDPDYSEVLGF
jgi:hypothetical protein